LRTIGQEVIRRTIPPQLNQAEQTMHQLQQGDIHIVAELSATHRQQLKSIERETRRTGRSVFIGSILVSSTLLYTNGDVSVAIAGYAFCGLPLLYGVLRD